MKKLFLATLISFISMIQAQENMHKPLITVTGEGKVKVVPDQVSITVSIESKGSKAAAVKKVNDTKVDGVLKIIAKTITDKKDYQTQRVYLNDQYDYEKKTHNYVATQTITILLKDISKYDAFMEEIVDQGVNNISDVQFKSSKLETHESEARKLAIKDAKLKAEDYVSALGQKIGKAFTINDQSQDTNYPQPMYNMRAMKAEANDFGGNQTLAVGEIIVNANVTISFILE